MKTRSFVRRLASMALASAALVVAFFLIVRPWYSGWGATVDERVKRLPGDEIVVGSAHQETRAISIDAPPERVWLWVSQLGQNRGGFYSYELLEDLAGSEMTNLSSLHPELQRWKIGDKLWMYPPSKLEGMGHAVLRSLEPGRALGFATRRPGTPMHAPENGSWSFIVEAAGNGSHLLVRGRAGGERGIGGALFDWVVFEPMHFAMERKMLTEIKARAEGRPATPVADNLQVVLWTLCFGVMIGAGILGLTARSASHPRWLWVFVGAAVVFQFLTFVQPPLVLGAMLMLTLLTAVFWAIEASQPPQLSALRPARSISS
jgi:hypothetical protein